MYITNALEEYRDAMYIEREVLDDAGLRAIVQPREMWTFLVNDATQKNFEVPGPHGRRPKAETKSEWFKFKLMGVYSYGHSFTPFLIHDSQHTDANATWTCLWTVMCRQYADYGYWPT
jgi:hypothetical protein